MKTNEERTFLLHQRARKIFKEREKAALQAWGSLSAVLSVMLLFLGRQLTGHTTGLAGEGFAASSMLGEETGGYVLVAVFAFAAGVLLAVLIRRYRDKKRKE